MTADDQVLYPGESRPSFMDRTRRSLLKDFEKVRNRSASSKLLAKRKFQAEAHLSKGDEPRKVRR